MCVNPLNSCYSNRLVNERKGVGCGGGVGWGAGTPDSFDMQIKYEVIAVDTEFTRDHNLQFHDGNRTNI